MAPRRNRVNNEADPAFTAAVAHAVADLLPTLTTRITDEIRQNENNGITHYRKKLDVFQKQKPQTFSSASTPVEAENWIAHIEQIFEGCGMRRCVILNTEFTDVAQVANAARNIEIFRDRPKNEGDNKRDRDGHRIRPSEPPSQGSNLRADDRRDSDRYGNRGRHGNMDRYGTDRWRGDRQGSDRHGNGSNRQGNGSHKAWRDQDQQFSSESVSQATVHAFECGEVGHLAKDCKKGSTSSGGKRFDNLKREYLSCVMSSSIYSEEEKDPEPEERLQSFNLGP
ncbi:putative reverse transcriptase domain-containing protein [Tanacetum coccineum]|uniref:Reverse transcriptase domain-containing protein n=1 Tax=Tanacetum coccineum TaxID=301880 RepID=A0ABQ5G4S7_9ASTR